MIKTFEDTSPISGNRVKGGVIESFASSGISDRSHETTLIVENGYIRVPSIDTDSIKGGLTVGGDLKVEGMLTVTSINTKEIINDQQIKRRYLEFTPPDGSIVGTGLIWSDGRRNRAMVMNTSPDRIWSSENFDLAPTKSYMIDGQSVLSPTTLGDSVTDSKLSTLGNLQFLKVNGDVNIDNHIFYNKKSNRLGIGTDLPSGLVSILDYENNVEFIVTGDKSTGYGKFGTFNTKGVNIVTDDTTRVSISETGNITLGQEHRDSMQVRVYGRLSIGVKNPTEMFEVGGNARINNQLFSRAKHPPTDGVYNTGDIFWNTVPRSGGFVGWVCTQGGSPGTWRTFGEIS